MEALYNFANSLTPLSDETFKLLKPYFNRLTLKSNTVLCNTGDDAHNLYFILSGVARTSAIMDNDKIFTRTIHTANQFLGPYSNLINNEKSNLAYETLTDCEIIEINHKNILKHFGHLPEMMQLEIKILQNLYEDLQKTIISLGTLNAKERYLKLLKRINGIEELIPQYQIASYLGITPIQLSRIRKSLTL
jgi:CRP-like cAMP-binding protein